MADGNSSPVTPNNGADTEHDANKTPPPDAMPPPPSVEPRQLEIHFNGSGGESVTFKLKNVTRLRKAMDAYSARVQRPVDQLRFLFEGNRLGAEDTPAGHDMEDGDIVEVHMEQIGGGGPHREKLQDWVEVEPAVSLLQQVCNEKYMMRLEKQKVCEEKQQVSEEKARLMVFNDRLKRELAALKTNNRALARDNNIYKARSQQVEALLLDRDIYQAENQALQKSIDGLKAMNAQLGKEKLLLKSTISQKDAVIDSIVQDLEISGIH